MPHSSDVSGFVAVGALAVLALSVTLYVTRRIASGRPGAPGNRFRFFSSLAPALGHAGMLIREDVGPGTVFRLIAAGPHDTSPRASSGHNVFADCNLQHTEHAAWVAQEFAPAQLRAIYEDRVTLFGEINPGPEDDDLQSCPCAECLTPSACATRGECTPAARTAHAASSALLPDAGHDLRDPLNLQPSDCNGGECPTPSVCAQAGCCADTVPPSDLRD